MNAMVVHTIDIVHFYEKTELTIEKEEIVMVEETLSVGNTMNTLGCVFLNEKKIFEEPPLSEDPPQKKNSKYKLRSQCPLYELEVTKHKSKEHLLRKITPPLNSYPTSLAEHIDITIMKCVTFFNLSIMTMMESCCFTLLENPVLNSMDMTSHFHYRITIGYS